MNSPRLEIQTRRSSLVSLVITAVSIALGINLLSSWVSAPMVTSPWVGALGASAVLVSLAVSYLGWRPPQARIRFKTGAFIGVTKTHRIAVVPHKHFAWAAGDWLEAWSGHGPMMIALPKIDALSDDDRNLVAEAVAFLVFRKFCELSKVWHDQYPGIRPEALKAPGLPDDLLTPIPLRRESPSNGRTSLRMTSSIFGTCVLTVRPLPDAIQRVNVSPVFAFARLPSDMADGSELYAVGAEVECVLTPTRWAWFSAKAESLAHWYEDVVTNLRTECDYAASLARLEQLVLFELFRLESGQGGAYKQGGTVARLPRG